MSLNVVKSSKCRLRSRIFSLHLFMLSVDAGVTTQEDELTRSLRPRQVAPLVFVSHPARQSPHIILIKLLNKSVVLVEGERERRRVFVLAGGGVRECILGERERRECVETVTWRMCFEGLCRVTVWLSGGALRWVSGLARRWVSQ